MIELEDLRDIQVCLTYECAVQRRNEVMWFG
jgi:hypothetical protein